MVPARCARRVGCPCRAGARRDHRDGRGDARKRGRGSASRGGTERTGDEHARIGDDDGIRRDVEVRRPGGGRFRRTTEVGCHGRDDAVRGRVGVAEMMDGVHTSLEGHDREQDDKRGGRHAARRLEKKHGDHEREERQGQGDCCGCRRRQEFDARCNGRCSVEGSRCDGGDRRHRARARMGPRGGCGRGEQDSREKQRRTGCGARGRHLVDHSTPRLPRGRRDLGAASARAATASRVPLQ